MTAPAFRSIDQLTGTNARPSAFFEALDEAGRRATDAELVRDAFARSVGFYICPCGDGFDFPATGGIDDYAALNRWLGHHGRCTS
ncbi:hypothetical protein [Mycolicibacterium conceptionense]|uniref:Uncharacterized protein n=1 Tax=Mycolicibacterium conceptionense TaxID=451644 RepID=A0A1A2VFH8_9MYCO|nr:hypothetical protein [Mycolicibacterium conceptionense]OBF29811.1 hypothetical protein A5726_29875 [Mycolicibacterium conceptionense]OBF43755.1 hypothetical protein A5720_12105 [Mycolicibacterium conceptionense]OBH99347.1 hypothetical protein A5716_00195 [Mycolicibacterium conceptionense]